MQGTRNIRNWVPVFTGNPGFLLPCLPAGRRRNDNMEIGFEFYYPAALLRGSLFYGSPGNNCGTEQTSSQGFLDIKLGG
jgi:hypothetical protein